MNQMRTRLPYFEGLPLRCKFTGLFILLISSSLVTATVWACGWDIGTEHSVRFNPYRRDKDFGRLPDQQKNWRARTETSLTSKIFAGWGEWQNFDLGISEREEQRIKESLSDLWTKAADHEQAGNLYSLRETLNEYLAQTSAEQLSRGFVPDDLQTRRNAAFDMLDALTALDEGSPAASVKSYLDARKAYDGQAPDLKILEPLSGLKADKNLQDNVAYLEAAIHYRLQDDLSLELFAKLAATYPKSEKRESALFMNAVLLMKRSNVPAKNRGEVSGEDGVDDFWRAARSGFARLMREYPRGRYYADAEGWLAHLYLRIGDRVHALAGYYRMLGSHSEPAKVEALFSLNFVRNHASDEEMRRVENLLIDEPDAALAYAYHNIYNYGAFSTYDWNDDDAERQKNYSREVERIVGFATRMVNGYPKNAQGGAFLVRLAEANFELEKFTDAEKLAARALTSGVRADLRAEAQWIAGIAAYRLKKFKPARETLLKLIAENPNNRYTEGARRNLAMLEEDSGNLDAALEQYLALDYRPDATYFMEVLMTTEQVANFVNAHATIANRDELLYALGLRYLKDFRWDDARRTFSSIRPTGRDVDSGYLSDTAYSNYDDDGTRLLAKLKMFDPTIRGIRPQWLEGDLRTTNDLQRLENVYKAAPDDEAKAEALYQFASYIYQANLLFYNPVWRNNRHYMLYDLFEYGGFREANESQLLFEYMQKHDMASRSLDIYLDVVKKFPNTRAARDALYTAAVCHERLRGYNNYWGEIYSSGGHAGERKVEYADVKRAYPDYRFPLGTIGWEPATRTVDGGPGWAAVPKPRPQPTTKARALRQSKIILKKIAKKTRKTIRFWLGLLASALLLSWKFIFGVYRCLWFGFTFIFLCLIYDWATEARQLLQEELALCHSRPHKEEEEKEIAGSAILLSATLSADAKRGPLLATLDTYLNKELRDEWKTCALDLLYKIKQLKQYQRGKSLLALTASSYVVFVILFIQVITAIK